MGSNKEVEWRVEEKGGLLLGNGREQSGRAWTRGRPSSALVVLAMTPPPSLTARRAHAMRSRDRDGGSSREERELRRQRKRIDERSHVNWRGAFFFAPHVECRMKQSRGVVPGQICHFWFSRSVLYLSTLFDVTL